MQNKHLEHPEDCILTGNMSVLDWFTAPGNLSVKIDGAPAIVWGRNPATGNFFVGTKSVFNKKLIKINETHSDIDRNHSGRVADILHACFDYLPRTNRIIQGDFIGFGGDDTFCPNTITYIFPEKVAAKIIIAPHTYYTAESDLRDAVAHPMKFSLNDSVNCKFVKVYAEICPHLDDIEDVCKFAKQMSTLCTFVSDKQAKKITQVLNRYIREGESIDYVAEYDIASECECDVNLIRLWNLVQSIKMDLFCFIAREDDIKCYIDGQESDHEGYVLSNKFGTYKIVNRRQFSCANFNLAKNW